MDIDIDGEAVVEGIMQSAGSAINAISGTLSREPSGLAKILIAYGPKSMRDWIIAGRFNLIQLKKQEEAFSLVCNTLVGHYKKLTTANKTSKRRTLISSAFSNLCIDQLERDIRLLNVVQKAFTYLPDVESRFDDNEDKKDSDQQLLWLDNFESLARRRNEPWRVELLSRAIAEIELSSRSISLKALWELGMLEEDDFNLLAIFCDSALDVDGRPLMLILPEEQIKFELDSKDGAGVYNLAYAVNMLVDKRLVQKIETQVETSCPVLLKHSMGAHYLHHTIENLSEDSKTAIQIIAFEPTDYCLDICRLYDPDHNSVSYANFEILKNTLEEGSEKVENFGLVDFKEVLP